MLRNMNSMSLNYVCHGGYHPNFSNQLYGFQPVTSNFCLELDNQTNGSSQSSGRHLPSKSAKYNIHIFEKCTLNTNRTYRMVTLMIYWQDSDMILSFELPNHQKTKIKFKITQTNVKNLYLENIDKKDSIYLYIQANSSNPFNNQNNFSIAVSFDLWLLKLQRAMRAKLKNEIMAFKQKKMHATPLFKVCMLMSDDDYEVLFNSRGYSQYYLDPEANRGDIIILKNKKTNDLYISSNLKSNKSDRRGMTIICQKKYIDDYRQKPFLDHDRILKILKYWYFLPNDVMNIVQKYARRDCLDIELGGLADKDKYHYCNIGFNGIWWSLLFKLKSNARDKFHDILTNWLDYKN